MAIIFQLPGITYIYFQNHKMIRMFEIEINKIRFFLTSNNILDSCWTHMQHKDYSPNNGP